MTTRHLVDPELLPVLDAFSPFVLDADALRQFRRSITPDGASAWAHPTIGKAVEVVPGPAGEPDVRVLVYRPLRSTEPLPVLLWLHGGGFVLGEADADEDMFEAVVNQLGCAVVSVDYRLAPETPAPGAVEDAYAALRWIVTEATRGNFAGDRIAIGGASSGGGLAAALGLLARDRGEIPLGFQLLIYPMLDDRTCTAAQPNAYTGQFIWTPESNRFAWSALLGQAPGGLDVTPYAVPARAERLDALPPTFIAVGTLDLFLDEDLVYAHRLMRSGVPTELHVYPGAFHGFDMDPPPGVPDAAVTGALKRDYMAALGRALIPDAVPPD
ncbi:MAG: alpha/beta hydrolase [Cyanobacteria bacterium RYN_339]|nr:alpha/beta hydrolase [Cyanobacteria bacterium RYN_339]